MASLVVTGQVLDLPAVAVIFLALAMGSVVPLILSHQRVYEYAKARIHSATSWQIRRGQWLFWNVGLWAVLWSIAWLTISVYGLPVAYDVLGLGEPPGNRHVFVRRHLPVFDDFDGDVGYLIEFRAVHTSTNGVRGSVRFAGGYSGRRYHAGLADPRLTAIPNPLYLKPHVQPYRKSRVHRNTNGLPFRHFIRELLPLCRVHLACGHQACGLRL